MKKVLFFDQVFFRYNETPILNNVTFSIDKGEFVGIIGPNGGGKTTLLKLIMGFLKPLSGKIKVFGKEEGEKSQKIAYVPQNLRYDREFPISVKELVLLGRLEHLPWFGKFSGKDHKEAREALEKVGIRDLENEAFGKLSGGQQQRALIARALASKPKLLLLDEPTANVDAKAESDIYALLQTLKGSMTILIVTHDLKIAVEQVDRVLCVQHELISYSPKEVCEHYAMGLYHPPLITANFSRKAE